MQHNKELAVMSNNHALQFFLEDNDHAKAAEMAKIIYNGAEKQHLQQCHLEKK